MECPKSERFHSDFRQKIQSEIRTRVCPDFGALLYTSTWTLTNFFSEEQPEQGSSFTEMPNAQALMSNPAAMLLAKDPSLLTVKNPAYTSTVAPKPVPTYRPTVKTSAQSKLAEKYGKCNYHNFTPINKLSFKNTDT